MISDPFELHAGTFTPADLRVVPFRGRDALSELFSFQLVVQATPELEGRDAELLGSLVAFVLRDGRGAERRIEALVDRVRADAAFVARTGPIWHLRLVPALALLRRRTTSRIFQDETVPQILQHVLAAASISVELRLSRTYAVRSYCVQYRESDLAFVRRLAAEEGIAFCFADAPPGTVGTRAPVIFLDDPSHYPAAFGIEAGTLVLGPEKGLMPTGREIISFGLQRSIKPSSVHLRHYAFQLGTRARAGASLQAQRRGLQRPPSESRDPTAVGTLVRALWRREGCQHRVSRAPRLRHSEPRHHPAYPPGLVSTSGA
ncbi:contractile injection system protein, VgrG/Pvc8 family [Sorangium sp. So ce1097]|uniref:contractile injection system protein, VgrG/Pvc8 family n=1 Tax=Sorangium sp. So ce1097 TaxID=3133330 RepID=UPI003F5EDF62